MIPTKDWGKGLNKDQPPFELSPGFWSDAQNMRFRNGKAERMGGISTVITPTVAPYWIQPYSNGTTRYVAYAGTARVFLHDGTTETEITRTTTSGSTGNSVSAMSRTGTTVTVTTPSAHGLTTGNSITMSGANKQPGFNGTYTITVTSTTTFTYTSATSGSYTWSTKDLRSVSYVTSSGTGNNFSGGIDDKITGGNFNGVLVYNNPVDGLYYLDFTASAKLKSMTAFTGKADVCRPFKYYLFLFAPTVSGTKYYHQVLWSAAADPGSIPLYFTADVTNDAGAQDLVSDGEMVDGLDWGEELIIYKRDVRFKARYIGGDAVFDFQLISGNSKDDGLLAAGCIVNTPKGQVFLTDGKDIRIHQGYESNSIANGRVLNYFRTQIDSTYQKRSFLVSHTYANEVWVCFPTTGNSSCNKALVWNWEDDTWGIRDLTNVTAAGSGELPLSIASGSRLLVGNSTPTIALSDSGTTDYGSAYTSMLERTGMDLDTDRWKTINGSMPRFDSNTSGWTATIYHGAAPTPDTAPTYASPQTYTHNTTRKVMALSGSGPYLAWKMTTQASDTPVLRGIDFDIKQQGDW